MSAGNHGGLAWFWWDFSEACGCDSPGDAPAKLANVSMAWNPRKVLEAIFGDRANAAYGACYKWSRGAQDYQEALREAVSAACEWAVVYHGREMRQDQDVSLKPGNYVRESLSNTLEKAARDAGPDRWKYGSVGDHCTECDGKGSIDRIPCDYCEGTGKLRRRKWIHAYRVELPDDFGSDDDDGGESHNELNDPKYRPPDYSGPGEEDPDALMREQLAALIDPYLATQDEGKVRAFRAIYMSQEADENSLRELAKELGVSHETVRRWSDEIFGTLSGLFST